MRLNETLRTAFALQLADRLNGGFLRIHAGPAPASAADPIAGPLLVEIVLPVVPFNDPVAGVLTKAGEWFGSVIASGEAGCYRLSSLDDAARLDGPVSLTGGTGEVQLNDLALAEGQVAEVAVVAISFPGV